MSPDEDPLHQGTSAAAPASGAPGSSQESSAHLNGHHRETLAHLMQHPAGHNIDWRSVVSLLEAVADVEETHHGKLLVTLGGETETFEPPRHKDVDTQQVVDLRRMLKAAGYGEDVEPRQP